MVGVCAAGMSAGSGVATLGALASDCGSALDASVSLACVISGNAIDPGVTGLLDGVMLSDTSSDLSNLSLNLCISST